MFWVKLLCYLSLKLQKVVWVRERNQVSIASYFHQYCKTECVICIKKSINLLINEVSEKHAQIATIKKTTIEAVCP